MSGAVFTASSNLINASADLIGQDVQDVGVAEVVNIAINTTTSTTTTISGGNTDLPVSWCHDLQGSDFVYTPTLYSTTTRHIIAVAFIVVIIITVIGNAFVIIAVITDKPLRKITNALVVSMALSDISVAMCGELQSVITMLSEDAWVLSDILCEVFTSADLYFSLSGILHIVCLAGDRYLAICHPFKYEIYGHKYMVMSITSAWTLPVAFSFLPIMLEWHRLGQEKLYTCLHNLEVHVCTIIPNKGFSTISFLTMYVTPSLVMAFCYSHIYRVAMSHKKRFSTVTLGSYSSDRTNTTTATTISRRQSFLLKTDANAASVFHNLKMNAGKASGGDSAPSPCKSGMKPSSLTLRCDEYFVEYETSPRSSFVQDSCVSSSCPNMPSPLEYEEIELMECNTTKAGNLVKKLEFVSEKENNIVSSCPDITRCYFQHAPHPLPQKDNSIKKNRDSHSLKTVQQQASCDFFDKNPSPESVSHESQVCFTLGSFKQQCESDFHAQIPVRTENIGVNNIDYSRNAGRNFQTDLQRKKKSIDEAEAALLSPSLNANNSIGRSKLKQGRLKLEQFLTIRRNKNQKFNLNSSSNSNRAGLQGEEFHTARSISMIFVCFAVTWSPYWVTMLAMPYLGPGVVPDPVIGACLWLAYFGSALNPFVYYFSNSAVKRGIRRLLLKMLRRYCSSLPCISL